MLLLVDPGPLFGDQISSCLTGVDVTDILVLSSSSSSDSSAHSLFGLLEVDGSRPHATKLRGADSALNLSIILQGSYDKVLHLINPRDHVISI